MRAITQGWLTRVMVVALCSLVGVTGAATPFYVDDARPDDTGDGLSWATAKQTIQAAVDLTGNGDTVWVTNGTYDVTAQISITNAITLRSVNGPEVTTIRRDSGTTRILRLWDDAGDAVVSGFTLRNGLLTSGYEAGSGAGVYMAAGTVTNCIIRDNQLTSAQYQYGAGVFMSGGLVTHCLIVNNENASAYRQIWGGGVYKTGGTLRNSIVTENSAAGTHEATDGGGGVLATGGEVVNCLIYRNTARHGGGYRGSGRIENTTIAYNLAAQYVGRDPGTSAGIHGVSGIDVVNSIVYFNTNHVGAQVNYAGTENYSFSCTTPLPAGVGNVADNPGFADAAMDNFRLRPGSPAIDAGTNLAWMASSTDLDGNDRILPVDGTVDMGAYEYQTDALSCYFVADTTAGFNSAEVVFTATVDGTNLTDMTYYWDFNNDGTPDLSGTGLGVVTNTYGPGLFSVGLTVSNAVGEISTFVRDNYIRIAAAQLYVATNGNNVSPYTDWTMAATSLHAALNLADAGSVITVSNGIYNIEQSLVIDRSLTLQSLNGPEVTTIQRGTTAAIRLVEITAAATDAVVSGFTLRDGWRNLGNVPAGAGAGVLMAAGTVTNCIIRDNRLTSAQYQYGAGIYMTGGLVVDSTISDNSIAAQYRTIYGGGVYMTGGTLRNCIITDNSVGNTTEATNGDGGVYATGGDLINCLIARNRAERGGGFRGVARLINCTIADNVAQQRNNGDPGFGAGIFADAGCAITNSIVYFNTNHLGSAANYTGTATWRYSCMDPPTDGTGNVTGDPSFVSLTNGNFRLRAGSPAIDSGTNLAWMAGTTDLDGNDRILPVDGTVDMGAYEYMAGALSCSFTADVTEGFENLDVVLTSTIDGTNLTGVAYHWDFTGDGTTDLSGSEYATVTNNYGPGLFTVTLTVSNQVGESSSLTRANYIRVAPAQMYVATNGTHVSPFLTMETAATDIQSAINLAASGTVITVANGVYDQALPLTIDIPLTLQSVNGPDVTIIRRDPAASNTRVLLLDDGAVGAVVSGFTFRDGNRATFDADGGSGVRMLADATITNCVIRDNILSGGSGQARYGAGVYMTAGRIVFSSIINNSAPDTYWGNYGGGVYLGGGELVNCVITNNSAGRRTEGSGGGGGVFAVAGTRLVNCLLANNQATDGGGLRGAAVLMNCTVAGNSALTTVGGGNGNAGGILGAAGFAATNTIVYANTNHVGDVSNYSGTTVFRYSLSTPKPDGEGNIDADPLFVDAAGGDYRLQIKPTVSPAIDAGTPPPSKGAPYEDDLAWINTAVDLAGEPRYSNDAVDMGAYEMFIPPAGSLFLLR